MSDGFSNNISFFRIILPKVKADDICLLSILIKAMRLFTKISSTFAKEVSNATKNISVKGLLQKYSDHFNQNSDKYESPLLQTNGLLAYTNRFAKTTINLGSISKDQKKYLYKRIKKSILSGNFTPLSAVEICESLINFPFDGDEEAIFDKLRAYVKDNQVYISSDALDRLEIAYKYIMIEKVEGNIQFKELPINKIINKDSWMKEKVKNIMKLHSVKQYDLEQWVSKKQIRVHYDMKGAKRNIMIKTIKNEIKAPDALLIAKRAVDLANADHAVVFVKPFNTDNIISQQQIQQKLLKKERMIKSLEQLNPSNNKYFFNLIIQQLKQLEHLLLNPNIQILELTNMQLLNKVLSSKTIPQLQSTFGYLKFNAFHLEFQKILKILHLQNRKTLKQMFKLNLLDCLELEEKKFANMITPLQLQAKQAATFIKNNERKVCDIFLQEKDLQDFLVNLLHQMKTEEIVQTNLAMEQNKKFSILKDKLALVQTINNLSIDLPAIKDNLHRYNELLYPISGQLRQSK